MTNLEKTELVHATQVVLARQKQLNGKSKEKRLYRRWTYEEIYTLEFAICLYGYNYAKIAEVYQDRAPQNRRTESQVITIPFPCLYEMFIFSFSFLVDKEFYSKKRTI
jgi:hypothetical protein